MPALHLIISPSGWASCAAVMDAEDTLVLLEDGVYLSRIIQQPCSVIATDGEARGILNDLANNVRLISYDDLVDLVVTHQPVITWT